MERREGVTEALLPRAEFDVEKTDTDVKCWSKRQTDGGRNGGFLEGNGERGWWGSTWIVVSFVQTSSVENGEITQISSFSCAVFVMWSQSVCLAETQKTHIYFCPPSLVSFLFISPLSLSVLSRLVETLLSELWVCFLQHWV